MNRLRVPGRTRLERGDCGLSLTSSAHGNHPNAAAGRTGTAPRRGARGRVGGARAFRPRAGHRVAATGLSDQPDRPGPASDHAGNRPAPRPLLRRLRRDLAAPRWPTTSRAPKPNSPRRSPSRSPRRLPNRSAQIHRASPDPVECSDCSAGPASYALPG